MCWKFHKIYRKTSIVEFRFNLIAGQLEALLRLYQHLRCFPIFQNTYISEYFGTVPFGRWRKRRIHDSQNHLILSALKHVLHLCRSPWCNFGHLLKKYLFTYWVIYFRTSVQFSVRYLFKVLYEVIINDFKNLLTQKKYISFFSYYLYTCCLLYDPKSVKSVTIW